MPEDSSTRTEYRNRSGWALPVCRDDGHQPGDLRQIRCENRSDTFYDLFRYSVRVLLSSGISFRKSGCRFDRLRLLRFLGRHHVARNDQSHITAHSAGRHGAVRYAGDGRRSGRRIWSEYCWKHHTESRRKSPVWNAGWQRISPDIGHIAISHKKADKTSL